MLRKHRSWKRLVELKPAIRRYQKLASEHGIDDIFQDNGGKLLEVLLLTGLTIIPGREGDDAKDAKGTRYELKTMNAELVTSFSTHHHLNPDILAKYRKIPWIFAIYRNIEIVSIYLVPVGKLERYFSAWEEKIKTTYDENKKEGKPVSMNAISINNPKINASYVEEVGELYFGKHYSEVKKEIKEVSKLKNKKHS